MKKFLNGRWIAAILAVIALVSFAVWQNDALVEQGITNFDSLTLSDDLVVGDTSTFEGVSTFEGAFAVEGTTPSITIGDAGAENTSLVYDGIAQDFYIGLEDATDDLVIGVGSVLGTTQAIGIDENQDVTFAQQVIVNGVQSADAAATHISVEIAATTGVHTTGTNVDQFLACDVAVGAATGGVNSATCLQIDAITDDAQVVTKAINIGDEWDYALDTAAPVVTTAQAWWQDFLGGTAAVELVQTSGSDGAAVQAIVVEQFGVYQLTSGAAGTNPAADAEAVHSGLIYQADQGSLVFEARMHLDGDILTASICLGFTDDSSTSEVAATIAGTTITTVADDAVVFCYDTDADVDQWYAIGVAGTTDATGNAITGVAPTVDVYQVFRIEVDSGGADARFYIDGALVGTLTANAITNTDLLSAFVVVDSAGNAASHVIDIDYIFAAADRD